MVSNALWRGMQASARTLPRRCARSPVLASSGRRVYMCPGAMYAAQVHMCPGAVCAARVCEKRACSSSLRTLCGVMQSSARTLPRTSARSPSQSSSTGGRTCVPGLCPGVCAFVRRGVRERAHARAHARPRTNTCLFERRTRRGWVCKVTCAPTHMLAPCVTRVHVCRFDRRMRFLRCGSGWLFDIRGRKLG